MDGFETLALEVLLTCKRNQDTVLRSDGLSVVGWVGGGETNYENSEVGHHLVGDCGSGDVGGVVIVEAVVISAACKSV